jgi:hypothetical protein
MNPSVKNEEGLQGREFSCSPGLPVCSLARAEIPGTSGGEAVKCDTWKGGRGNSRKARDEEQIWGYRRVHASRASTGLGRRKTAEPCESEEISPLSTNSIHMKVTPPGLTVKMRIL